MSAFNHSPEPWTKTDAVLKDANGEVVAVCHRKLTDMGEPSVFTMRLNAERIALVVNYCAGLTDQQLLDTGSAINHAAKMRIQGYNEGREYQLKAIEQFLDDEGVPKT